MKNTLIFLAFLFASLNSNAQTLKDTIKKTAEKPKPLKINHAEPLYLDLIRDLGAIKGEKELNFGMGVDDYKEYMSYSGFMEYEFAVANRLGVEVEVPFKFYQDVGGVETTATPQNRIEGLKVATQYTFLVSEKYQTSMAVGYIQEFEFSSFSSIDHHGKFLEGILYNPIFIVAKKWTPNVHTLLYTGPVFEQHLDSNDINTIGQVNASFHYSFAGGNFIGLEPNMEFMKNESSVTFRPQIKQKLSDGLYLGFVTGIPTAFKEKGLSFMTRIIWEP